ncbi:MAG TPA: hypothetical protein ENI77_09970 [Nitrospirae bacterium]|nr:hypothetical protein [Nitrospirota bacterium]
MIIHRYSEYEEPDKPPFTLDDVIAAITEMMMRHHVEFNEALQYLIDLGLPINEFLRDEELDHLLDEYIDKVGNMKDEIQQKYDFPGLTEKQRARFSLLSEKIRKRIENDPEFLEKLKEATGARRSSKLYEIKYDAMRHDVFSGDDLLAKNIEDALRQAEILDDIERFHDSHGKTFTGGQALDPESAKKVTAQFKALDKLKAELEDARSKGNLNGVDEEALKEFLGGEAYDDFKQARDKILEKLKEAIEATGQVEERDGIFKLTPAAARKVGDTALREVYASLKTDGAGAHEVGQPGEGSVEKVNTRPYEYGDSLAHLDVPGSMINALKRGGGSLPIQIRTEDMEIHDTHGVAKSSIVVMIDMSGSMSRFGRFYNAKKMTLALDAMIRSHYPEDSISFIGFATFARRLHLSQLVTLGPEPITFWGGGVRMNIDMSKIDDPARDLAHVPRYFTNIQKGLEMARLRLMVEPGLNKEIILITDGAPTAYFEGQSLVLHYPPGEKGYAATLREVRACKDEAITLNAFLLGSDFDTGFYGEDDFIDRMMKIGKGRLFHPQPGSLTEYVLVDYINNKRKIVEF